MKHYQFKMRDEYGNESLGNVDAEDWKAAWRKLGVLMKAGYKILVINDLDEPEDDLEESDMSILQLVKKRDVPEIPEQGEPEAFLKLGFTLLSGEQINVCAKSDLVDRVSEWFSSDDEDLPQTISLKLDGTIMSLDRMFVGALFVTPLSHEDMADEIDEEDGSIVDLEQGNPTES